MDALTTHDIALLEVLVISTVLFVQFLVWIVIVLRASRIRRPPLPDVILPEGWCRWWPDGRGTERLYEWKRGAWREVREQRVKVEEIPES